MRQNLSLFLLQQILKRSLFGNKSIVSKPCSESETGNEAVESGFAIYNTPYIHIFKESLL